MCKKLRSKVAGQKFKLGQAKKTHRAQLLSHNLQDNKTRKTNTK